MNAHSSLDDILVRERTLDLTDLASITLSPALVLAGWSWLIQVYAQQPFIELEIVAPGAPSLALNLDIELSHSFSVFADQIERRLGQVPGTALYVASIRASVPDAIDALRTWQEIKVVWGGGQLQLRSDLTLDEPAFGRYADQLAHVYRQLAQAPDRFMSEMGALPAEQVAQVLDGFNQTRRSYPAGQTIEQRFSVIAWQFPDRCAVMYRTHGLTYQQLEQQANGLAARLRAEGVVAGQIVALLMSRAPAMVVATLAILKAGGVYLPIDPDYPEDRINYLLRDSGAGHLLVDGARQAERREVFAGRVMTVDDLASQLPADPAPLAPDRAGTAAYVMYTSGTTGQPKGAIVTHKGVMRLVCNPDYVELDQHTRMLQAGAIGFDAATFEVWGALLNGGCLQIVDRDVLLDATALGRFLALHQTTCALITTSLFNQLAEQDPALFKPLHQLVIGGDVISPLHVQRVLRACTPLRLINAYGPTENTVISTACTVTEADGLQITIGRPIANSTAFILNRFGYPVPIGVEGELCVGGDGLGLGYLNQPDLTRAAFRPEAGIGGRKIYHTGDMARWREDGRIEFLGRRDHQVKIRGFRVETSEIEQQLLALENVREALVLVLKQPVTQERVLVAYVTLDEAGSLDRVRHLLAQKLAWHMVPAAFVRLSGLPLATNGKVDRSALPLPEPADFAFGGLDTTPPSNETEQSLARLWAKELGMAQVGIHASLYELGASSLTATLLAGRIEHALGLRCPVAQLLATPTIAQVAVYLDSTEGLSAALPEGMSAAGKQPLYAVSAQQHRVYIEQMKDDRATHYHLPMVVQLPETLDAEKLLGALQEVVQRHEILRTDFLQEGTSTWQRVHEQVPVELNVHDYAGTAEAFLCEFVRPFQLSNAPLWRAALVRHSGGTALMFDIHHIITDGFSLAMLFRQWAQAYDAVPVAQPGLHYKDYAQWISQGAAAPLLAQARAYWHEVYRLPFRPLDIPCDHPRTAKRSNAGGRLDFELGSMRTAALRALARERNVTLFQVLLAGYGLFLARVSMARDVTLGTPVSGRNLAQSQTLQGMFVNTVCLRLQLPGHVRFDQFLQDVAGHANQAFDHQIYPFDGLVKELPIVREPNRNPLFDSLFALQNTDLESIDFLGGQPRWVPEATQSTIFELNLQISEQPQQLTAAWMYSTDLFLAPTIGSFRDTYLALLDALLADPSQTLDSLITEPAEQAVELPTIDFCF
ncbi:amino acid adenylation domain-containing protein [Pseudomonas sp. NPDC087697]|uniref:amino acid adenylation domain-containing protein n=1 Tax=Pseudomonas sp. NPDC087697 TaxID=3364447 RepID=UPI00381CAF54